MIFPDTPRVAYRKNPSLRNKLVRVQLQPVDPLEGTSSSDNFVVPPQPNKLTVVTRSASRPANVTPNEFYGYKTPPTFKQLSVYPFTLFPKRKLVKPCFRENCGLCKRLYHKSNFVKSKVNKRMLQVKSHGTPMTCHTKRVVYLIQCTECCKQYVGQTTKQLNHRVNAHLSSIRGKSRHSMSWHFNNDHPIDCLSVTPVEKVSDDISPKEAEGELQRLETLWILRLATQQPMGMNFLVQDTQSRVAIGESVVCWPRVCDSEASDPSITLRPPDEGAPPELRESRNRSWQITSLSYRCCTLYLFYQENHESHGSHRGSKPCRRGEPREIKP